MSFWTSSLVGGLIAALLTATTLGLVEPFCEITPARRSVQVIKVDPRPQVAFRTWLWAAFRARLTRWGWGWLGAVLLASLLGLPADTAPLLGTGGLLLAGLTGALWRQVRTRRRPTTSASPGPASPCAQCPSRAPNPTAAAPVAAVAAPVAAAVPVAAVAAPVAAAVPVAAVAAPVAAAVPVAAAAAPVLPGVAPGCQSCPGADPFAWIYHDPLVQRYQKLFRWLDFDALPPCPHPHGLAPQVYVKTFLVAVEERHTQSFERFHRFLVEHPALIVFLGYRLHGVDPTRPFGFDPAATLVSARHLKRKLQELPHAYVQHLLLNTIVQLAAAGLLKDCIAAVDVAEVWAKVSANNPKAYVPNRYDKTQTQGGAPSARLGVKASSNQGGKKVLTRSFWGWKNGAIAVRTKYGLVCLHDLTQPADGADVRFFRPLLQPLRDQLHRSLFKIVADAAFDAGYVYQDTRDQGGTPYIALNTRGPPVLQHRFGTNGRLLCADGREMDHAGQWFDRQKGYRRPRYTGPFYNSQGQRQQALQGQTCHCQHPQFATGGGRHTLNLDDPAQVRFLVDRGSRDFKQTYARRTDAERLFALAADYHLEHPEVESLPSVANLNTLLYLLLNVRVLEAAAAAGDLTPP
jgi:hypothetical protein